MERLLAVQNQKCTELIEVVENKVSRVVQIQVGERSIPQGPYARHPDRNAALLVLAEGVL